MPHFEQGWHRQRFRLSLDQPKGWCEVDGIQHNTAPLGIHFRNEYTVDVTHTFSGRRVAGFDSLGAAFEFVNRVATMFNWSVDHPAFTEAELTALQGIIATLKESSFRPRGADGLDPQVVVDLAAFLAVAK